MNNAEVREIERMWEKASANPTEVGTEILIKFFTKYPSNLEKFPMFSDIPLQRLQNCPRFKAHANKIVKVFDDSIKSIGNGAKLEEIWTKIATSHFNRDIEKQSFNELKEIILEVLAAVCDLNEQQVETWIKLMDIIYDIIFKNLDSLQQSKQCK